MKRTVDFVWMGISALVSLASGTWILFTPLEISRAQAVGIGAICILVGLLYAGVPRRSWAGVWGFLLFGAYAIGRATGRIEVQWLRYGLGVPLVAMGLIGAYKLAQHISTAPKTTPPQES
jgi:hypothetical protein